MDDNQKVQLSGVANLNHIKYHIKVDITTTDYLQCAPTIAVVYSVYSVRPHVRHVCQSTLNSILNSILNFILNFILFIVLVFDLNLVLVLVLVLVVE